MLCANSLLSIQRRVRTSNSHFPLIKRRAIRCHPAARRAIRARTVLAVRRHSLRSSVSITCTLCAPSRKTLVGTAALHSLSLFACACGCMLSHQLHCSYKPTLTTTATRGRGHNDTLTVLCYDGSRPLPNINCSFDALCPDGYRCEMSACCALKNNNIDTSGPYQPPPLPICPGTDLQAVSIRCTNDTQCPNQYYCERKVGGYCCPGLRLDQFNQYQAARPHSRVGQSYDYNNFIPPYVPPSPSTQG